MLNKVLLPMKIVVVDILDCIRPKGHHLLSSDNLLNHIHKLGNVPRKKVIVYYLRIWNKNCY